MTSKTPLHEALADYLKGKRGRMPSTDDRQWDGEIAVPQQLTRSYPEIAKRHPKIMQGLSERDRTSTAALVGALLTLPELQSNSIRLEALVHLSVMACNGPRKPKLAQVSPWFDELDKGPCGRLEDPAEDVFVAAVSNDQGSYRLFEGTAEGNAFYVQIFLNVIAKLPKDPSFDFLRSGTLALLKLSEAIAQRAEIPRNAVGNPVPRRTLPQMDRVFTERLRARMRFNASDLQELGIERHQLAPFIFDPSGFPNLAGASVGNSTLENAPLLAENDEVYVVLPTTIGLALRRFVIEACIAGGMRSSLERALALTYADFLKVEPLLGQRHGAPIDFHPIGKSNVSASLQSKNVDEGRFLDLLIFCDSLNDYEKTSFAGRMPASDLNELVTRTTKELKAEHLATPGFKESLLLVVGCGWGRALGIAMPPEDDQFRSAMLSAHDLVTLSRMPSFEALDLFKLLRAYETATDLGAQIVNASGLINLVAWAGRNKGHIIPHDDIDPGSFDPANPLQLMIPQNENLELRANTANGVDIHSVQDPSGSYVLVRRKNPQPAYGRSRLSPFYIDLVAAYMQRMRAVYQGKAGVWWVEVELRSKLPKDATYHLGQMVLHWAEVVAHRLDSENLGDLRGLTWEAHFADEAMPTTDDPVPDDLSSICQTVIEPQTARIRIGPGFLAASHHPLNVAERVVVRALVTGGLELLGLTLAAEAVDEIVLSVVKTDSARHFHAFSVPDVRDHVRGSLPDQGQHIAKLDDGWSRLGLGWLARHRDQGHTIEGVDPCCDYLRVLLDKIIERMRVTLSPLNRTSLVMAMLENHEALVAEGDLWKRTFGAVASLADSQEKAEADAMEKIGAFNAGRIASRIVLEMGLCTCSETATAKPGQIEIGRLLADASLLFHMGGFRDAIRDGIMEATVRISPGGDVQMNHDFTDKTARAYGKSFQQRQLNIAVERYKEHYQSDDELEENKTEPVSNVELEPFSRIWLHEFDFTLEDARAFASGLSTIATDDKEAVVLVKRSHLIARLVEITKLSEATVEACLQQFTLVPRANWNSAPAGYLDSSWQPWRFRRQLSLVCRPIVELDKGSDPMIALATAMTVHHIVNYMSNVFYARFDQSTFKTAVMKRYVGETTGNDGEAFNERVAERLRALGWQAKANLSDGEILRRAKVAAFGDVDVLAWKPDSKRVLAIECKDLSLDKTLCPFRCHPAGDSDLIRPSIPFLSGQGFRSIRPSLWGAAGQCRW